MLSKSEKSIIPLYKKIMFFSSGLSWFSVTLFATLYFGNIERLQIPLYIMLPGIMAVLALVCFLFPIIYSAINRSTLIVMGRYHLPLIISVVVAAFSIVGCFTTNISLVMNVATSLISLGAFMISFLTFEHIVLNLGLRLFSFQSYEKIKKTGMFVGILSFFITLFLVFNLSYHEIFGYAGGIVMLISGVLVYFSTVSSMPRFINLETPEKITFKKRFATFFSLLARKDYRIRTLTLGLLGGGISACILFVSGSLLKISLPITIAFVIPLILTVAISYIVLHRLQPDNKISFILSTVFFSLVPIGALMFIVMSFVSLPSPIILLLASFGGIFFALALSILIHAVSNFFFQAETEGLASLSRANGNKNLLYLVVLLVSFFIIFMGESFLFSGSRNVGIIVFSLSVAIMIFAVVLYFIFPLSRELRELVEEEEVKNKKKIKIDQKKKDAKQRKDKTEIEGEAGIKAQMESSIKDKLKEILAESENEKTVSYGSTVPYEKTAPKENDEKGKGGDV